MKARIQKYAALSLPVMLFISELALATVKFGV